MSDVITKPGPHRERSGGQSKVHYLERCTGFAFGYDSLGRATAWHCETGRANFGFSIISEWHDPPTPPDGFKLMPADYVAKVGDMVRNSHLDGYWFNSCWNGSSAADKDCEFPQNAPHFIASQIVPELPKPGEGWRLLEDCEVVDNGDEFMCAGKEYTWHRWNSSMPRTVADAQMHFLSTQQPVMFRRRVTIGPLPDETPQPKFKVGDRVQWTKDADVAEWIRGVSGVVKALYPVLVVETDRDHTPYATDEDKLEPAGSEPWTPTCERPPLGLKPQRLHDGARINEVFNAISRYKVAHKDVPLEWYEEMYDLSMKLWCGTVTDGN